MKKRLLLALAIAGFAATTGAQAQTSYSAGNIFLGFRSSGGTGADKSYLVNLGNFADLTIVPNGGASVQLFNLDTPMTTIFGNDWYTRGQVTWGIFGMPASKLVVYSSTGDEGNAPVKKSVGALSSPYALYSGVGAGYNNARANGAYDGTNPGTLAGGVVTGVGAGTWAANIATAADFGVYNATLEAGVSTDLDLWGVTSTTQTKHTQYNLSSSGDVSVVPEPSTYALFGLGALMLILAFRRKAIA